MEKKQFSFVGPSLHNNVYIRMLSYRLGKVRGYMSFYLYCFNININVNEFGEHTKQAAPIFMALTIAAKGLEWRGELIDIRNHNRLHNNV